MNSLQRRWDNLLNFDFDFAWVILVSLQTKSARQARGLWINAMAERFVSNFCWHLQLSAGLRNDTRMTAFLERLSAYFKSQNDVFVLKRNMRQPLKTCANNIWFYRKIRQSINLYDFNLKMFNNWFANSKADTICTYYVNKDAIDFFEKKIILKTNVVIKLKDTLADDVHSTLCIVYTCIFVMRVKSIHHYTIVLRTAYP